MNWFSTYPVSVNKHCLITLKGINVGECLDVEEALACSSIFYITVIIEKCYGYIFYVTVTIKYCYLCNVPALFSSIIVLLILHKD